jgi:acyl-homoserine lactone acylase PvdQ
VAKRGILLGVLAALAVAAPAPAQLPLPGGPGGAPGGSSGPAPQGFRENDGGGFFDVLPPGTNGTANGPQLAAFLSTGARPPHNNDQLAMYGDLVYAAPELERGDLLKFFKDASFGVRADDVDRTYSPRSDVTVVRDKSFGVPHVYGKTRDGAMFGLGYVAAEDRLFLMDALRHVGRGQLASFAGGAQGNRNTDADQWEVAPYTEADLQRQVDQFDDLYGADGKQVQRDAANYVAGVNAYIQVVRTDPTRLPAEYPAIGRPEGPTPWKETDIIATAALVGGIFGKGGGGELDDALLLQTMRKRFGRRRGDRMFRDFRSYEDPEAPTTVRGKRFTYGAPPARPRGVAMPDLGSVTKEKLIVQSTARPNGDRGKAGGVIKGVFRSGGGMSNALLVSGRESASGRPLAVFGPQTSYYSPQLLMEQDVHAPATEAGPAIDARGAAFAGTNLYVQLGRGRDYSWSATSAGQDIIDTYAVELCEPGGGKATKASRHYLFRGQCVAMEELRRRNSWSPTPADQTPAGSETLVKWRTKLGLVTARATIKGKPFAYTKLRRTYMHEIDSAFGFADFNNPDRMRTVQDFQRAANKIMYTFNWLYVDDRDIGYLNSGANPVRPRGVNPHLPTLGRPQYEWRGFDPDRLTADITPFEQHPQTVNQRYLTSWNNKQAPGFRAAGFGFTSLYRSQPLDRRIERGIKGSRKMSLVDLINAMEDAGTVDLRGERVLPWALRVIGRARRGDGAKAARAVRLLGSWVRSGAHRRDRNRNGVYEHSEAIAIMDAWWPRMLRAQFEPVLGKTVFAAIKGRIDFDDHNRTDHIGSAFQNGWYGYPHKDLRTLLKQKVRGRYGRVFCGRGSRARCRTLLVRTLVQAVDEDPKKLYDDNDPVCPSEQMPNLQMCSEAVRQTPVGGITQPLIHWINRPTYQQAVEVQGHRPR